MHFGPSKGFQNCIFCPKLFKITFLVHFSYLQSSPHFLHFAERSLKSKVQGRAKLSPIPGGSAPLGLRYKWQPIKGAFNAQVRKKKQSRATTKKMPENFLSLGSYRSKQKNHKNNHINPRFPDSPNSSFFL